MRRLFLGIILPILLLVAVGVAIWFVATRARPSAEGEPNAPGNASATGELQVVAPDVPPPAPMSDTMRARILGNTGGEPQPGATQKEIVSIDEYGNRFVTAADDEPTQAPSAQPSVVPIPSQTAGAGGGPVTPVTTGSEDTDRDGLTTDQELQQGTSPQRADTDNDGLTDGDEVRTHRTDPLNPDSDGDTYLDGAEIRSGYNPNGAGAL